jgi:hypothetical protein
MWRFVKVIAVLLCFLILSSSMCWAQDDDLLDLDLEQLMNLEVIQVTIPGAHWHWEDDWMIGYQYVQQHWKGHQDGTDRLTDQEVLAQFPTTHERMTMHMHMLMFMHGNSDELTFMAMVPWMEMDMPHLTRQNTTFTTRSQGLGDVQFSAIVPLYDEYPHRIQFEGGLSLPTGAVGLSDLNGRSGHLEYAMQLGSGTVDLRPKFTYLGQTDTLSWGAQGRGVFRVGRNREGYALGNEYGVTTWISPAVTEEFSPSLRIDAMKWGNVRGVDNQVPLGNPAAVPGLQAGERVDLLLGLNYAAGVDDEGHGHRFSIEGGIPVYQNLEGPQLRMDYKIGGAWQWTF